MSIKKMSKEELELLSYKDIAAMYIKEEGPSKTVDIFKFITEGLELPKSYFENKIADFYTMLSTDKRFVILDGIWDLREKHPTEVIKLKKLPVDDDDDDDDDLEEELEEKNSLSDEEDYDANQEDDGDFDDSKEDLKNLVIIDEEELELE